MIKPFEFQCVEKEKAEAMKRYNNRKSFLNILRVISIMASLCYLWLPTVSISIKPVGDWFYQTGSVILIITNRTIIFLLANILVAIIFIISRDRDENSCIKQDLYDQYTASTATTAEKMEDDDTNKQIVPAEAITTGSYRRMRSEKRKDFLRPVKECRRMETEDTAMERLSSEEFRLRVEKFIMEKKKSLVH